MFGENNFRRGLRHYGTFCGCSAEAQKVAITRTMNPSQSLRVADGRPLQVTEMTCPVRMALHTSFGPVTLDPFVFAVMPGTDDLLVLGCPMLEVLNLNIYTSLTECARRKVECRAKPMEIENYIACRCVSLSEEAMQEQPTDDEHVANQAVERVVDGTRPEHGDGACGRGNGTKDTAGKSRTHCRPKWI